jgi:hypothetical protein
MIALYFIGVELFDVGKPNTDKSGTQKGLPNLIISTLRNATCQCVNFFNC